MKTETTPEGRRLFIEEDLSAASAERLRNFLCEWLAAATGKVFLELSGVQRIDGRGLALLAGLALSCRDRNLVLELEAVRPDLQQLLEWCELPGTIVIKGEDGDE